MGEIESRIYDRLLYWSVFNLTFFNFKLALTSVVDFGISMGFAVNARTDGHTQTDKQYILFCFNYTPAFNYITPKKWKSTIFVRAISFISEEPKFDLNLD